MGPESHGAPIGRFSYDARTGKWDWDDEVYRIHGLEPGSITVTTEKVLGFKHPEDRAAIELLLDRVTHAPEAFSVSYRIVGGDSVERRVVLVGESAPCDDDTLADIEGYYIDLTGEFREESQESAQQAVEASARSRADIEQAKGILMLAYGLDADQAFAMLQWWSRNRNVKLRDLAERLVTVLRERNISDVSVRAGVDALLHDISSVE
jgi:hypothetical protein